MTIFRRWWPQWEGRLLGYYIHSTQEEKTFSKDCGRFWYKAISTIAASYTCLDYQKEWKQSNFFLWSHFKNSRYKEWKRLDTIAKFKNAFSRTANGLLSWQILQGFAPNCGVELSDSRKPKSGEKMQGTKTGPKWET